MDKLYATSASLAFLGILALVVIVSGGARATNDPPSSGGTVTGDWTVTDSRTYNDVTITLAGNLYVENGGVLVLGHVQLVMDASSQGQYGIDVHAGGKLVMQNSATITSSSAAYRFRVRPQGALNISDIGVRSCGYAWGSDGETAGLFIESDSCNLTGATFSAGYYGVVVRGASIAATGCRFTDNSQGCVVIDSAASFADCDFEYNQNGANFDNWSGNMTGCTFAFNSGFGLLAYGSTGNISHCDFVSNGAGNCLLVNSGALLSNCTFRDSLYGLYLTEGAPQVTDCTLTGNRYGAYVYKGAPSFAGCTLTKNSLYGLSCLKGAPALADCTIRETGYSPRDNLYYGRGITLFASNLSFAGGNLSQNYFGIEARYSTLSVSDVQFFANSGGGIWAVGSAAFITDCDFAQNLQIGAHLTDFCSGAFECCTFTCMTQGAAFDHGTSTQMRNSTFNLCKEGLRLFDCDPDAAVIGCVFENNSIGASLMGSASRVLSCSFAFNVNFSLSSTGGAAEVRNCTFRDCPTNALTLDGCGGIIDGNLFDAVEAAGISAKNSTSEISQNTFRLCNGTAIYSFGTGAAPNIHGNLFFKNGMGVALSQGSGGRVHHNNFTQNEQAGLSLASAHGEIFCNTVSGSLHGISCIILADPSIHDNDVFGNEGGIICSDSSNATVTGNRVHDNSRFGIQARMSWPSLAGNDVWGNVDGIRVDWCPGPFPVTLRGDRAWNNTEGLFGQGSLVEIEGCNFSQNSMSGVRLVDCLSTVRHSVFDSNRDGLRPEGGSVRVEDCDFLENNSTGIITDGTAAVVDGCYFFQNTDGALDLGNSTIHFEDGVFTDNIATGFYCQRTTVASWTVGRTASAQNDWFALRGNLTVLDGGSLRMGNCTLSMILSSPGESNIEVQSGGRLVMLRGSRVEAADPDNEYSFRLLPGGNLTIEEGTLQGCGGGWGMAGDFAGLVLQSSSCSLREVLFQNCSFGLVADGITGDFEHLTFSGCDWAVIAMSSTLRLDNSTIRPSGTMDLQLQQGSALTLVNTTFDRGKVSLLDQKCVLEVYWYLGIGVAWQNNAPIEGAELVLSDAAGGHMKGGRTDERGWLMWVPVLEFWQHYSSMEVRNPYNISVSKANVTWGRDITFQKSEVLPVTLYDLVPPVLEADHPAPGAVLNRSLVEFGGLAADHETGLEGVEWSPDGLGWQPANGSAQWSFLAELADGRHTVSVRAADAVGNRAVLAIDLTVKTRIGLELRGPAEGLLTRLSEVPVTGTTESIASVRINGLGVAVIAGNFSAMVPLVEGNNTISVFATDEAGNSATITRTVVLDTTPPILELQSPRDGSYTNIRETTVSGRTEPGAKVTVNGPVLVNPVGHFAVVVPLPSDVNVLDVTAIDAAGNPNSTTVTVLVDTEPPALSIASPKIGYRTAARGITIKGTTEPFSTVTIWDRSATAGEDGSFSLNVTLLYGNNTLMVESTDRAGNTNAVIWAVVRDRPAARPGSPWAAALAGVAVFLVVENVAVLLYRRRRGGATAAAAPRPAGMTGTAPPTSEQASPSTPQAPAEAAIPEAKAEVIPPEALPVSDDEVVETIDMK